MKRAHGGVFFVLGAVLIAACGGGGNGNPPPGGQTGSACTTAAACYPDVKDQTTIKGTVTCLTKVSGGYCTHLCAADTDCCAVTGECGPNINEVCAPFENTTQTYCFLSCEDADVQAAGYSDPNVYCQQLGDAAFTCRSTGGGANNRKICSV